MVIKKEVGLHNRFDIVKRDAKTGKVIDTYYAENMILNNFWGVFFSSNSHKCLDYIHFGSGDDDPLATDVKLKTHVGYKSASLIRNDFSNWENNGIIAVRKTCRINDNEHIDKFISEIGFSNSTSNSAGLLTKALIRDMNGQVISIEHKSGEVLDIFATFFVDLKALKTFPFSIAIYDDYSSDIFSSLIFKTPWPTSSSYSYPHYTYNRPDGITPLSRWNRTALDNLFVEVSTVFTATFDASTRKVTFITNGLDANQGNIDGGLRGLNFNTVNVAIPNDNFIQPVIIKEVVGTGDGTNKDFQTIFPYVKNNSTAKIYVDDVEVSGIIDYDMPFPRENITYDLILIGNSPLSDENGDFQKPPFIGLRDASTPSADTYVIFENPYYATLPIYKIMGFGGAWFVSNDLTTWISVGELGHSGSTAWTLNIPSEHQGYRYWKGTPKSSNLTFRNISFHSAEAALHKNVHLTNAPNVGATVAITYQPDVIAKDSGHTLRNIKLEIIFTEYTP